MSLPKDPMRYLFPMMHDLYEVAHEDVNKLDPNVLIERIKGIHKGLSAEHEFAAIASWLGSTRLIVSAVDVLHSDRARRGARHCLEAPPSSRPQNREKDLHQWRTRRA